MAPSIKKYFIYIIFLVSPIAVLKAQSKSGNTSDTTGIALACNNQKTETADKTVISKLDNSNQLAVELSIPKDSFAIASEANDQQTTSECKENSSITASYSVLAKDIIENYKYDFSETFIDILFFENIDLARTRTI
ncbi:hypothetical protein [Flavobacterium denitrificans]|uniref:hypothetical protein n=1 Tax=Flavobacterium denitrificans TaxID=281361 RepID=UPI00040E29CE|nr:hypothetical protein [Flavobacterium denitrificans]